ncbi:MAG: methyltransferase, partial [Gemmatimonadota bacterium]|nr:methyltransferase [Gemmatimonadota bacterium]
MIVPLSRPLPFIDASAPRLAELRALLARLGYTEQAAWERMGCEPVGVYRNPVDDGREPMQLNDALDLCIRMFMDGEPFPRERAAELIGGDAIALLASIGLLETVPDDDTKIRAMVQLYPTQNLYIVSDRHFDGRVSSEVVTTDVVYPAITWTVARYLEALPRRSFGNVLEMCGGTGIAALVLSPTAERVWSSDITQRSTDFAELNARLNAIGNLTAVAGDMYEPVAGLQFDLIAAHPPYVPSLERKLIFRDGGTAGEEITQRVVAESPPYLAPGGRLYCTCMGSDRVDAPFEQRIRDWLGDAGADCDVFFFQMQAHDPLVY